MANGAPIWFATYLDNAGLKNGQAEADRLFNKLQGGAKDAGSGIEAAMKKAGAAVGAYLSVNAFANFARQMVDVSGQFQQLEIAFGTMLKSGDKAKKLMSDLSEFAATTPFGLQSSASAAKQLLAYGSSVETLIDEMRMLGDVAAGTSQPIGDLVYLYGTLRTQGRAYMMDIRQFAGRGIPIYDELAKVLGVSKDRVNEFVTAGKVGFAEVEQAFKNMTSSGGMYGGLMEAQSKSVTGRIEQLKDAVDIMFNEMGKASEGAIYGAISGAASLVENYEKVGKILIGLIATYGAYRAAVIAVGAVEKINYQITLAQLAARQAGIVGMTKMQAITDVLRAKTAALNATMLAAPYVLAATAVAALIVLMVNLGDSTDAVAEAQKRVKKASEELNAELVSEQAKIDILFGKLNGLTEGTDEYKEAKKGILDQYGEYLRGLGTEIETLQNVEGAYRAISDAALQSARDRAYAAGISNATDAFGETYSKNIGKLREKLIKEFGELAGEQMLQEIRTALDSGEVQVGRDVNALLNRVIVESGKGTQDDINDMNQGWTAGISRLVDNVRMARYALDKEQKELQSVLKGAIIAPETQNGGDSVTNNLTNLSEIISDIQSKTRELSSLRSQSSWTEEEKKKISDLSSSLDGLKKQYQELTGKQFGKSNTSETREEISDFDDYIAKLQETISAERRLSDERIRMSMIDQKSNALDYFNEQIKEESDALNEYLIKYGSYQEKRLAITQKYSKLIADAQTFGESLSFEKERDEELAYLIEYHKDVVNAEAYLARRRIEVSGKAYMFQIDREKELLEIEKKRLEMQRALLERQLEIAYSEELNNQLRNVNIELDGVNLRLTNMPTQKTLEVLHGFRAIADELGQMEGTIGDIFSGISGQLDNILTSFDKSASGIDKISAGVSGLVNIINMISSASANRKQAEKEFYQNQIALAHEYALALNEQLRIQSEIAGSGFLTDYAGQIDDAFASLADATNNYNDAIEKLAGGKAKVDLRNAVDWGNVGKGAASGAAAGAAIGSVVPVIGTAIGAAVGAVAGAIAGLFGGKKKKEVFGGLLEVFPELVDEAGNLNTELAQTIINTDQVDDNTKQLIQNALDWEDQMEAAGEQIKGIAVSLAGDLGNSLQDSIVSAWMAGEDASKSMFDAAGKSLEDFVEKLLYSTIFSDVFKEFEDKLAQALSGEGDILDAYDWLMNQMEDRDDAYLAYLDAFKKRAEERGYDMWQSEDAANEARTSASQGFAQASQDSIDKIDGILTNIQNHTYGIFELMKSSVPGGEDSSIALSTLEAPVINIAEMMRTNQQIQQANTDNILGRLTNIDLNTRPIAEMQKDIHYMRGRTDDMADSLDKFTRG